MNKKEIDKKTPENNFQDKDNNTFLYILFFLLFACLVGLAVIWWSSSQGFSDKDFNPTSEEIEKIGSKYKEARDLIRLKKTNQRKREYYRRKLDKNFNPKLTSRQKTQLREKLNDLDKFANPIEVAARLNRIRSLIVRTEVVEKQLKLQEDFLKNKFPEMEEEVKKKINEFLIFFFNYAFQEFSKKEPEKLNWKGFVVRYFKGEIKDDFSEEEYAACKAFFAPKVTFPPEPEFNGFDRFLDESDEEEKAKKEGTGMTSLFGLEVPELLPEHEALVPHWDGDCWGRRVEEHPIKKIPKKTVSRIVPDRVSNNFSLIMTYRRAICIRLKKELLFSREGEESNEWIEKKAGDMITYYDVGWENARETMAHELAHAVIDKMMENYNKWEKKSSGQGDGEGHGPLHDRYTEEIENMIINHAKGKEFEKWWKRIS